MSFINYQQKEINFKIVYYGPAQSGKTTCLEYLFEKTKGSSKSKLIQQESNERTLFFDFMPLFLSEVDGYKTRFHLYTVPGQVFYEATRRLVVQGADGVVFVADSDPNAREDNFTSLAALRANLTDNDVDVETFPVVFQLNKRDLPNAMSVQSMNAELNWLGAPVHETCATVGTGVLPALRDISKMVIRSLLERLPKKVAVKAKAPAPREGIEAELARVSIEMTTSGEIALTESESPPPVLRVPEGALSFATLWEGADAVAVAEVESAIRAGEHGRALGLAVRAMVELLDALPGTGETASPMAKAALLGLDGREFLRFCRLASLHAGSIGDKDALFALYMLVSARLKASQI